ncbi:MAG TPA: hypothetical protein DGG94_04110 [Micromonosporaceae bacterium]|nr:hypothetical protein [Micromonosporaceae bacterium]HCU48983.1 hypothetical protein [Micromonosporaceae bacterium]
MKLTVTEHRTRHDGRDFRVLRPNPPIRRTTLRDVGDWYMLLCTDNGEAMRLAACWHLAGRPRQSLVHIPLRHDHDSLAQSEDWWPSRLPLDLLLMHHSLQVPASQWKPIRARLDRGRPRTVETGIKPQNEFEHHVSKPWRAHDSIDVLDLNLHADTLIATGSEQSLRAGSFLFMQLAIWAPSALRANPSQGYYSATMHPLDGLLRHKTGKGMYLIYIDPWLDQQAQPGIQCGV